MAAVALVVATSPAFGAGKWRGNIAVASGALQQPSSQYYLLAFSTTLGLDYVPAKTGLRLTIIGRPEFNSGDYTDQDYGGFLELHQNLIERGSMTIGAGIGSGQMRGYVKSESSDRSDYQMRGPSCSLDLTWAPGKKSGFNVLISHHLFAGLSTTAQTNARVAWPWTATMVGAGVML